MTVINSQINLKKMQASADEACRLMKVLSNRDRMLLLCEISVLESSKRLSTFISQHFRSN